MGRFRKKIQKFADGKIPLDREIWELLNFSNKMNLLKGMIKGLDKQRVIDMWYEDLRDDYKVEDAFDKLKAQLIEDGFNPETFGVKYDAQSFNRAYLQRKNRRLKRHTK